MSSLSKGAKIILEKPGYWGGVGATGLICCQKAPINRNGPSNR
jgi:hypothetical protein